jgi:hypothetical protein
MALQHLRSSAANKRPSPAAMSAGQLALNTNNGSPGLFFKDANGALVKVGPVHVGTTAPNATPASGGTAGNTVGEQWLDTTGGGYVFKTWDGTAWRTEAGEFVNTSGDTMTGPLATPLGSAATPSLTFSGDPNTGIFSPGADQVAVATNGTGRLFVNSAGNVGIGTTSPGSTLTVNGTARVQNAASFAGLNIQNSNDSSVVTTTSFLDVSNNLGIIDGHIFFEHLTTGGSNAVIATTPAGNRAVDRRVSRLIISPAGTTTLNSATSTAPFIAQIAGAEAARIDSSGRLLVGTSTARSNFFNGAISALTQVEAAGGSTPGQFNSYVFGINTVSGPYIVLGKHRSDTVGASTVVQANDQAGGISFQASDGTEFVEAARVQAFVDGTPGANDMPGRLVFSTTADGASSPTERMRITQAGNVGIGTTNATERLTVNGNIKTGANFIGEQFAKNLGSSFSVTIPNNAGVYELAISTRVIQDGEGERHTASVYHIVAFSGFLRGVRAPASTLVSSTTGGNNTPSISIAISTAVNGVVSVTITSVETIRSGYNLRFIAGMV